jgi:cytochrome c oxidase subunit 2
LEPNEKKIFIAAVVLLLIFFAGLLFAYRSYGVRVPDCVTDVSPFREGKIIQRGEHQFEVQMVARMWAFEPKEVVLPPGSDVTLYLASADVVHGMQILGTDVNLMAVPGTVNLATVTFDREGEFPVVCHEYCGAGHQNMAGKFVIRESAAVAPAGPGAPPGTATGVSKEAMEDFDEYLCLSCHSLDGSNEEVKGLYGKPQTLTDGTTVIADDAYLRDAIVHPGKQVVQGYDPMPELGEIPDEEVQEMIDAIRKLGD